MYRIVSYLEIGDFFVQYISFLQLHNNDIRKKQFLKRHLNFKYDEITMVTL